MYFLWYWTYVRFIIKTVVSLQEDVQRSLKPWCKGSRGCFCAVVLTPRQGGSHSFRQPRGNETGLCFWGSTCSFRVARTLPSHLRADRYIHCFHPSHAFKTGQALGVWWINHDQSAVDSLKHGNLLNLVAGRTANDKSPVTWSLTFSHSLVLLFSSVNQRFTHLLSTTYWIHELSLCPHTRIGMEEKKGRKDKILVIWEDTVKVP